MLCGTISFIIVQVVALIKLRCWSAANNTSNSGLSTVFFFTGCRLLIVIDFSVFFAGVASSFH